MSRVMRALFGVGVILGGCRPSTTPTTAPTSPPTSTPAPVADTGPPTERASDRDAGSGRPPANAAIEPEECNPFVAPLERKAGALTVHAPPDPDRRSFPGRMRHHIDGALTLDSPRVWVGPQAPGFMPLIDGTKELFLLEKEGDVFVGMYRDPYGATTCDLDTAGNCDYSVQAFNACGNALWAFDLAPLMSRDAHLEIGDMRYVDGIVYFNEACQSYAKSANGKCSATHRVVKPIGGRGRDVRGEVIPRYFPETLHCTPRFGSPERVTRGPSAELSSIEKLSVC